MEPNEKAINPSSVGHSVVVDKELIRVAIPTLTEEYRKSLVRVISEKQEETRRTIRKWREETWHEVQEKTRAGEIREDDKFRAKDKLQDLIDKYNQKIEEVGERKKKEITT